ncbi:MAG: LptF/LptG family permease [Chitinophagaceae bacterium]|nr:LptF/LptG family permease [Chitinophagaceae bacterium]
MKILDRYIIRKFLGTFFLTLALFIIIAIVFDVTEKLEDFLDGKVPLSEIIFDYYLNFIPYFAILFTPLFLFVAVIFFTSRMAYRSEIVAILNSGITFNRMLLPYMVAAGFIAGLNIYANHWLIPNANKVRIAFEDEYIGYRPRNTGRDIHMQIAKDQFIYLESFNFEDSSGYKFSYEIFREGNLIYKMRSEKIKWDGKKKQWLLKNYMVRTNNSMQETLKTGKDTLITYNFLPKDFEKKLNEVYTMNARELNQVINELTLRGADNIAFYEVEKYKRTAFPFAIFILTLIGVSLASRKVRGGIGLHLGLGITISFSYIMFQQFSQTFSTNGELPPVIGVWIPNLIFGVVAVFLYLKAPK